jgi:lipopolysaccharide biosynthesis protein
VRAAIYVSFDAGSVLQDHVVAQVAALAACGRRVIFMSNSPALPAAMVARLAPFVREVVHRRNFGHDFGAYKDGLARLGDLGALHSLVLMNDSCLGPFRPLAVVEARAEASGCGIFGITENWAHAYHVQTYYVWLSGDVVRSAAFAGFWRGLLISQPRSMVIFRGEIRFTQEMLAAGFSAGALCPYGEVARVAQAALRERLGQELAPGERAFYERLDRRIVDEEPLNATHFFWDVLLTHFQSPFIKRELVRDNPEGVPGVGVWREVVKEGFLF